MKNIHVIQRVLMILAILILITLPLAAQNQVRILQSNAAGDRVHIIDPATNKVVGVVPGIEAGHGVTASPDGSRMYVSSEADDTLDVADLATLKVIKKIPLSGHPNNIAIAPDGKRVYVGIHEKVGDNPGVADVIDTASLTKIKSIRTGDDIRPMAISKNPDGSSRSIFVQIGNLNGFVVVDFKTRKEVARIELPKLPPGRVPIMTGSSESHGIAVTADQKTLLVNSRLNNALYSYSLPDLKLAGTAYLSGKGAAWITLTPDGKRAYVADPVGNTTIVVDVPTMKEVAKIPVGQVPKRNHTMVIAGRASNN